MIKELPQAKVYEISRCLQYRFMEQEGAPDTCSVVELSVPRNADAEPKKESEAAGRFRSRRWCRNGTRHALQYACKEKQSLQEWKQLHVDGFDGIECQHVQVMIFQLLQRHWEWSWDRKNGTRQGGERRRTVYIARLDIKTAFDVAGPKHIAQKFGRAWRTRVGNKSYENTVSYQRKDR